MKSLIKFLIGSGAVLVTAYIVPGVIVDSLVTAIVIAVVLGALNTFVRPILVLLTLPINMVTLGLFTLFINAGLVYLTSMVVPGFEIASFWIALVFGLVLSIISSFLSMFID